MVCVDLWLLKPTFLRWMTFCMWFKCVFSGLFFLCSASYCHWSPSGCSESKEKCARDNRGRINAYVSVICWCHARCCLLLCLGHPKSKSKKKKERQAWQKHEPIDAMVRNKPPPKNTTLFHQSEVTSCGAHSSLKSEWLTCGQVRDIRLNAILFLQD